MASSTEIEIKFPVSRLPDVETTLKSIDAKLLVRRALERNWRFDTPDGELTRTGRVLRVRSDQGATLTYKQPTGERLTRREIEIEVSSADQAAELLKGLGYVVMLIYEKYRQVYKLGEVEIMLDELPFGCFVEIEGPSETALRQAADQLGLAWTAGIDTSYIHLFQQFKQQAGLDAANLTFDEFEGFEPDSMAVLGLQDALAGRKTQG